MDSNDSIWMFVKRYVFPISITALGLLLLIVAFKKGPEGQSQTNLFLYASIGIFVMGVLSLLYTLGVINKKVSMGLAIAYLATTGAMAYFNYKSIKNRIDLLEKKDMVDRARKDRLLDVKDAEVTFRDKYNRYTASFDTLIDFVKTDSLYEIYKEGTIPEDKISMEQAQKLGLEEIPEFLTEEQAWMLGLIIRDTTMVPVIEKVFTGEEARERRGGAPFHADSLRYVPYSENNAEWELDAGSVYVSKTNKTYPVFMCKDPVPFIPDELKSTDTLVLQIGSMSESTTNGNWKD